MSYSHLLPPLPKGLAKSPAPPRGKRKIQRIPTMSVHNKCEIPEEVVAGIRWCADQGMLWRDIRFFYPGILQQYFMSIRAGTLRTHVLPRCPPFINEASWKERYRWSSTVKD